MATISDSFKMQGEMSTALAVVTNGMDLVTRSAERMKTVTASALPPAAYRPAEQAIRETGSAAARAAEQVYSLEKANKRAAASAKGLAGTAKLKGVMESVKGKASAVLNLADGLAQSKARLDMMNDGMQTNAQLQNMVYESAQRSRGAYLQMADTVATLGQGAGGAFDSNAETVAFAEQMNKLFVMAGASQSEMTAASQQLTQSLGTGKLSGEAFNAVFKAAPNMLKAVADYMQVPVGSLGEMAAQGQVTAETVKNALLSAADQTNEKFGAMPMTWAQVWQFFSNFILMSFEPVLQKISEIASSEKFQIFAGNAAAAIATLAGVAAQAFDWIASAVNWAAGNMDSLIPVLAGVAGAVAFFAIATTIAKLAQQGLNLALLSNPLFWIAIVIGMVIMMIVQWIQAVGGIRAAWLILQNNVLTVIDAIRIKGMEFWNWICTIGESLQELFARVWLAITSTVRLRCADMLDTVQGLVNGAIGLINRFIDVLNKIPGISIAAVDEVSFAAQYRAAAEQKNTDQAASLQEMADRNSRASAARELDIWTEQANANAAGARRDMEIQSVQAQAKAKNGIGIFDQFADPTPYGQYQSAADAGQLPAAQATGMQDLMPATQATADNTGKMADLMEMSNEDIKMLRDIAEREIINQYTTAEIKVDMVNNNNISSEMDLDGVVNVLQAKIYETMVTSAEGEHI